LTVKADVIIIGAGAAGLMAAMETGRRGRRVIVLDHSKKPGRKILMSGGGHCNFTNLDVRPDHYISHNPHFCKSALGRYTQWDFIDLVRNHHIAYSERTHGQLFCDGSSRQILDMLRDECRRAGVGFRLDTKIQKIQLAGARNFGLSTSQGNFSAQSLVVATGGLSMPASGATALGYAIAGQFQINVRSPRAGLVPLTLAPKDKQRLALLSGMAVNAVASNKRQRFHENILLTHRGLSGPAILQISSYWRPGEEIVINLLPEVNLIDILTGEQRSHSRRTVKTVLTRFLPKRLVVALVPGDLAESPVQALSHEQFSRVAAMLQQWTVKPGGTEGYRAAEVTVGGVDCDAISSKTMEARQVPGLYFIGEVLDVTGWLGGYNLQWAWSSGWCAGQYC
jgi:predicted Rossmann fold flavoprotein